MAFQMTNKKWAIATVAAFALGVSSFALFAKGPVAPEMTPVPTNMAMTAQDVANIEPAAGDATVPTGTVIADINGKKITLDELKEYIKTMPEQVGAAPLDQVFPMVQDQMVMGTIISNKATAEGLDNDAEVQARLAIVRDNVIRATYLEREVEKRMTDDVLKKEYDSFVKSFQPTEEISAQHILVKDEQTAKDIIAKLGKSAKFEDLVKEYSQDKGAKGDGDLGYFKAGDMVKEFSDAAFALKKGTTSTTPVKSSFGYHVIKVNDRRMTKAPSYDEMLPQLKNKVQRDVLQALLGDLRKEAKIELFDMKGEPVKAAAAEAPAADDAAKTAPAAK